MYFAKNELIELNNSERYLILDSAFLDDTSYYKVEKLQNNEHTNDILYISATNNEGKLYINRSLTPDIIEKLKEIC